MNRVTTIVVLLAVSLLGACRERVEAPTIDLSPTADSLTLTSGAVTEGAWLGGQRWALLFPDDATAQIIDFAAGSVTTLGRPGQDYRNPFAIFSHRDTLYVNDWGMGRTTVWAPDGTLTGSIRATDATRGAMPLGRDDLGHFYVEVRPPPGPDGSGNSDSAVVVRTRDGLAQADTIARLAPFDIEEVFGDAGRRFERRVFSGEDAWGVLPDGALWIARVKHNRVWWFDPDGPESRGPMLPDPIYPVNRSDREAFFQRFPPALRQTAERLPFAEIKPPFVHGLTADDGLIWLEKSKELGDTVQVYHVVGRTGELLRLIRVPLAGRILAVGGGRILASEPLPDGARLWQFEAPAP